MEETTAIKVSNGVADLSLLSTAPSPFPFSFYKRRSQVLSPSPAKLALSLTSLSLTRLTGCVTPSPESAEPRRTLGRARLSPYRAGRASAICSKLPPFASQSSPIVRASPDPLQLHACAELPLSRPCPTSSSSVHRKVEHNPNILLFLKSRLS
jgi:hypothetical protein